MTTPALSVVVPSVNGWTDLEACLEALAGERAEAPLEVLVVDRCGEALRERVARRFPWASVIAAPASASIPELRAAAFDRATAPTVAVIEDHVLVPRGWARAALAAGTGADVVGGAVRNVATDRLVDRAAFYGEYAHLMPPLAAGASVAGNHVVYDRARLAAHRDAYRAGRWEDHLHAAMRAAGARLIVARELVVAHRKRATLGGHLAERFHFARSWAGGRAAAHGAAWRAVAGFAALTLLPPLLVARTVARLAAKRVAVQEIALCLPVLALLAAVGGAGEALGSWFGAGRSTATAR